MRVDPGGVSVHGERGTMATLTTNLFWGRGDGDHRLEVLDGRWPTDMSGRVYIVGPDKRSPSGHWFAEQGTLCRIDTRPGADGSIGVALRRIRTPLSRVRDRFPWLFRRVNFIEISPFGISNLANTNVAHVDGRMFIGYDGGRPIEVDPHTLEYVTPVGANGEWFQAGPALWEPPISVAAHPGVDAESHEMYFVNYSPLPIGREVHLARWDLEGPIRRWRVEGMGDFDSIHDIKVSRRYVVFTDLPFVVEPATFTGGERRRRNRDTTSLWIVERAELDRVPPGGTVRCREVVLPMPTGHLTVDHDDDGGRLRVFLEHIPIQDLMIVFDGNSTSPVTGEPIAGDYEGLVAPAVQPGVIGRYVIDAHDGTVVESELAHDDRFWGAVLGTRDESTPGVRAHQGDFWYSSMGFDPELVPTEWWRLYGDGDAHHLVHPRDLPTEPIPASLVRIDRASMKFADAYEFDAGSFAHPPTFVPRAGATLPDDGYIVTIVHRNGPKEVWVFDASRLGDGPVARAGAPGFNPPLLLHSSHLPDGHGARTGTYRVPWWRDLLDGLASFPRYVAWALRSARRRRQAPRDS